jgi:hypothetical protein
VRAAHPQPDRIAARVVLAYFLLQPTSKRVEFEPELLFETKRSLGWDIVRAQARGATAGAGGDGVGVPVTAAAAGRAGGAATASGTRPAANPDYRFAVVQSELFRRHLRSAVGLDPLPLARYLSHFARRHAAEEHSPRVDAIVQAVLDQGVRGLGLEAA